MFGLFQNFFFIYWDLKLLYAGHSKVNRNSSSNVLQRKYNLSATGFRVGLAQRPASISNLWEDVLSRAKANLNFLTVTDSKYILELNIDIFL